MASACYRDGNNEAQRSGLCLLKTLGLRDCEESLRESSLCGALDLELGVGHDKQVGKVAWPGVWTDVITHINSN